MTNSTGSADTQSSNALLSVTTGAWVLFFSVLLSTTSSLIAERLLRIVLMQDPRLQYISNLLKNVQEKSSMPLNVSSLTSIYALLSSWAVLGLVLIYTFVCENHLPFSPTSKPTFDPDRVATWMVLIVSCSLYFGDTRISGPQSVSPLRQELRIFQECKGLAFLLYSLHRFYDYDDGDFGGFLNEQLFLGFYTWWTSFDHALYFYSTGDFGWSYILRSLWSPLSALLFFGWSVAQGKLSIYILCFMEVMAFLLTYLLFRVGATFNTSSKWGLRLKISLIVVIFYMLWDVPNPRPFVWIFGAFFPTNSQLWDWYILSYQCHWYVIFGVVFAFNWPIMLAWRDKLDEQAQSTKVHVMLAKGFVAVALAATSLVAWKSFPARRITQGSFAPSSFDPVVVLTFAPFFHTFLYVRSCSHWLRRHCIEVLEVIGERALEAYILHNHVVLCFNGTSLVTLVGPAYPKLNSLAVMLVFVLASHLLHAANESIKVMLFTESSTIRLNVSGLFLCLLSCLMLCAGLHIFNLLDSWLMALLTIFGSALVYSLILRSTKEQPNSSSSLRNRVPLIFGASIICLTAFAWGNLGGERARSSSLLPATCEQAIHQGKWIRVDVCNEDTKAYAYRKHGVSIIGGCNNNGADALAWGWQDTDPPFPSCRMSTRSVSTLLWRTLNHKNITFVGDSMVRHLYHATCRQVGHLEAGAYNTSMGKWSDFTRRYSPDTILDFRWAPFTSQIIPILQQLSGSSIKERPDLLVVGGGAWDLLYNTRSKDNRTAFDLEIKQLANDLADLKESGLPIVWVEPTKINTWALTSEDKRNFMREDQMVLLRKQYGRNGVLQAVTFVLKGLAFSRDRVNESYDGVHYPLSVYDGGSQILLNALDWLLLPPEQEIESSSYGMLATPVLGLFAVALLLICVVTMDSFFGLSYLAMLSVSSTSPWELYEDGMVILSRMDRKLTPKTSFCAMKGKTSDHTGAYDVGSEEVEACLTQSTSLDNETI